MAGINDQPGLTTVNGFCGTCHDTPDVGNHSVKLPINIGIANGGANNNNPDLDIADLPVFTLSCISGPNVGMTYTVTDPGRALISGKCADIGKVKGPILRGLAGRAPYFHNGSAAIPLVVPGEFAYVRPWLFESMNFVRCGLIILHRTVGLRDGSRAADQRQRTGGRSTPDSGPRQQPGWLPARAKSRALRCKKMGDRPDMKL